MTSEQFRYALLLDRQKEIHNLLYSGHYDKSNILLLDEHKDMRAHFVHSRNKIIVLLSLKRRRIPQMNHLDRFLIRQLGLVCFSSIGSAGPTETDRSIKWEYEPYSETRKKKG
jgi:hypothetical protein